ncbi:hypothetical protein [Nocardia testacea]|uniref:hypothetical protein n=1 Tax=Nocardia testacea TaxID=248551 RepID=UPI0005851AEF|nr:hypothetical protein [Nocardia testacea]
MANGYQEPDFESEVLPLSGTRLQWRGTDRCFRVTQPQPGGEIVTEAGADELLWRPWSGRADMAVGVSGPISAHAPGRWWVVWGEYVGDRVTVTLADGTTPPVRIVGGLWVSEWSGPEQAAVVGTATRRTDVRFAPPSFLPPPLTTLGDGASGCWVHVETPAVFRPRRTVAPA